VSRTPKDHFPGPEDDLHVGDVIYPVEYTTEEAEPPRVVEEPKYALKIQRANTISDWVVVVKRHGVEMEWSIRLLCLATGVGVLFGAVTVLVGVVWTLV